MSIPLYFSLGPLEPPLCDVDTLVNRLETLGSTHRDGQRSREGRAQAAVQKVADSVSQIQKADQVTGAVDKS